MAWFDFDGSGVSRAASMAGGAGIIAVGGVRPVVRVETCRIQDEIRVRIGTFFSVSLRRENAKRDDY